MTTAHITRDEWLASASPEYLIEVFGSGATLVPCSEQCDYDQCKGWRVDYPLSFANRYNQEFVEDAIASRDAYIAEHRALLDEDKWIVLDDIREHMDGSVRWADWIDA